MNHQPTSPHLSDSWKKIQQNYYTQENDLIFELENHFPSQEQRKQAVQAAASWIRQLREQKKASLMEVFLAEYGLNSTEGIALMCLAEALLRVPDNTTIDALIQDKIAHNAWDSHLGKSSSLLVNASTWSLMLTGKVLKSEENDTSLINNLTTLLKILGEPVIRSLTRQAIQVMSNQFVLGETIAQALKNGKAKCNQGYRYSFDMLGEAAINAYDAKRYYEAYSAAIDEIISHQQQKANTPSSVRGNNGISIKLSALHPRLEWLKRERVLQELIPIVIKLCTKAAKGNIGLNIDAEEANRLELMLLIVERLLESEELQNYPNWQGFGVVVQAYGKRAASTLDYLYQLAKTHKRKIMVRLVKGAYWDTEIKQAQELGVKDYPVFTAKHLTDCNYIACAQKLLAYKDWIYPQFATHNAHTIASILALKPQPEDFEFQQLHGMGEATYELIREQADCHCRIYAPVGSHKDLLAYLVRRLLENGANSSFVNQIQDLDVAVEEVVKDPFIPLLASKADTSSHIKLPADIYGKDRLNSQGWNLDWSLEHQSIEKNTSVWRTHIWQAQSLLKASEIPKKYSSQRNIYNPAQRDELVAEVQFLGQSSQEGYELQQLITSIVEQATPWEAELETRRKVLNTGANLYEQNRDEIIALLQREAGKTVLDAIGELREAVDFLRYYAAIACEGQARGRVVCISPWNFPLAIFTGQIAAALITGNAVLAKPAESTPTIAYKAVTLLQQAGVPACALQLVLGDGGDVGAELVKQPEINGVIFTGSTATAQKINHSMAEYLSPEAPLVAETGGLNAMIVDSTALLQQATQDIITSAFQSAGQRCSALRLLLVQEDVADELLSMLTGALDQLCLGNPSNLETDIGPVINQQAKDTIASYLETLSDKIIYPKNFQTDYKHLENSLFVKPTIIRLECIEEIKREIFGPVLHVLSFAAQDLFNLHQYIHQLGYGLTCGLHTRIDKHVEFFAKQLRLGNLYVNRNQIGAIVGSQPFGGEGLSGTGPKAGGPSYLWPWYKNRCLSKPMNLPRHQASPENYLGLEDIQQMLDSLHQQHDYLNQLSEQYLPGVTGEINCLKSYGRGLVLCLGPSQSSALQQAALAKQQGCSALIVQPEISASMPEKNASYSALQGELPAEYLSKLQHLAAVFYWPDTEESWKQAKSYRISLARRAGKIIPLYLETQANCLLERHVCIDTTASGGNIELLGA